MFFTRLGRIVAVLALIFGIWNVYGGVVIATGLLTPEEALARYFPSKSSIDTVIDGIYVVIFGIALGILTEIRYALERSQRPPL